MQARWKALTQRFDQLPSRDRRMLVAGVVVLAVLFAYEVIWEGANERVARLRTALHSANRNWHAMMAMDASLQTWQKQGGTGGGLTRSSDPLQLMQAIKQAFAKANVPDTLTSLKQEGNNQIVLRVEAISFDVWVGIWLALAENYQYDIATVSVTPVPNAVGKVTANMTIKLN